MRLRTLLSCTHAVYAPPKRFRFFCYTYSWSGILLESNMHGVESVIKVIKPLAISDLLQHLPLFFFALVIYFLRMFQSRIKNSYYNTLGSTSIHHRKPVHKIALLTLFKQCKYHELSISATSLELPLTPGLPKKRDVLCHQLLHTREFFWRKI